MIRQVETLSIPYCHQPFHALPDRAKLLYRNVSIIVLYQFHTFFIIAHETYQSQMLADA